MGETRRGPMTPDEANECVAEKFTRVMNATPSPIGPFSDLMAASIVSGLLVAAGFFAVRRSADPTLLYVILGVAAVPLAASAILSALIRDSRAKVVAWLCRMPFPVDNLNALLAGVGDTVELVFSSGAPLPTRAALQPRLESISDDILLVKERPEERTLEIRLGVIDSKRLPLVTNHRRWNRLVEVTDKVFLPLCETSPIERMRIV
jgi:hypothetical protein